MRGSTFTLRFDDDVGMRIATRSVGTVLTAVRAPRAVVDDVRLAVEIALGASIDRPRPAAGDGAEDGGGTGECVLAVACRPGRIAIETRLPGRVDLDRDVLLVLVDEVDVGVGADATRIGLTRAWAVRTSDTPST